MHYLIPSKGESFRIAVLVPDLSVLRFKLQTDQVDHLLFVQTQKDVEGLLKELQGTNSEYLVVSDTAFWKKLTKKRKTTGLLRYVLPCIVKGYEYMKVVYAPPPLLHDQQPFHDAIQTAVDHWKGCYVEPGEEVTITKLHTLEEIKHWLLTNVGTPLAIDIETFSLKHWDAGIGSIAFATDPYHAVAFLVDLGDYGPTLRLWLRQWFEKRDAWTLYHSCTFDTHILLYQLWMRSLRDYEGLRTGLPHIMRQAYCSKIEAYLALNSAQEISLSLKDLAQEFLGDWAVDDIKDITKIQPSDLLDYNAKDACAAFWVHQTHYPTLVADQQEEVYETLLRPAMTDVVEMQLIGIPFSMARAKRVHGFLEAFQAKALATILGSPAAASTGLLLAQKWAAKKNEKLKKKRVTHEDWPETFNVGSDQQLSVMLYEVMGLPVIETTPSGAPATDGDTLTALQSHTDDPEAIGVLKALLDWRDAQKLLTAFFPALLSAPQAEDGWHYLCGSYNIGGTVSGRMSSSGPNMQQIPATGARFAKVYKYIFCAPPNWIYVGADFNALESRIDALRTKDPNKLRVYLDGLDSHSWNAFGYWGSQMPEITIDTTDLVKKIYPQYRQASKTVTFALLYGGTWKTLVKNSGFSVQEAKNIESNYKEFYKVTIQGMDRLIQQASRDGYMTVAFGLRVRTPLLKKYGISLGHSQAEGRTVNNSAGQSWGMLNTRSGTAFLKKVREQKREVYPCAQIHDAQYFLARRDPQVIHWVNENLIPEMEWQDWPEIQHPEVGLGGELDVFRFSWAHGHTLKNHCSLEDVKKVLNP